MSGISDRLALPPETANPVRPGTQHEVVRLLSDTIGNAVLEEMDSREGFHRAGNPGNEGVPATVTNTPPAAQQVNPAATPVAPAQPSAPAANPQPGRKFLGKYNSEEEAERGYHSLLHLNKQVLEKNDELMRQLAAANTRSATTSVTNGQANPANPAAPVSFDITESLSTLQADYNIDPAAFKPFADAVIAAAETRAREAAAQAFDAKEAPNRVIQQADEYLLARYPEAAAFGAELSQFVHGDPELKGFVDDGLNKQDLRLPMEIAWLKFNQARLSGQERVGQVLADVTQQEIERTRVDAGLVSTQASGVHENAASANVITREDMAHLVGMYHSGYKEPFLRATIGATLPDDVFGI